MSSQTPKEANAPARKLRGPEIQYDSEAQQSLIEQAAISRGLTVTAFIRSSALQVAHEVLRQEQLMLVSDRDWDLVSKLLTSPPEPNAALKKLVGR